MLKCIIKFADKPELEFDIYPEEIDFGPAGQTQILHLPLKNTSKKIVEWVNNENLSRCQVSIDKNIYKNCAVLKIGNPIEILLM
ncbi:MAG: hypothetical protein IKZ49_02770 [Alphaproteobacteria bacterium]|nr:hypothetical protein [Alphaproteobacteria bacterium]